MLETRITGAQILIVDDQEANVRMLESLLDLSGYTTVHSTTNSRQMLSLFQSLQPDLLLLDLLMPHFDGFAVLEQLRSVLPPEDYQPILVLTADITPEAKHRALQLGATDFLTKPFDAAEVLLRIHNLLQTRMLHRQLQQHNQLLEQKVAERTEELLHARDAALESSRLKSEFLQSISHELRTPIAQVIGISELLLGTPLDAEQAEFAGIVQASATSLLSLIDSILEYSWVESGSLKLDVTDFDLRTLIEETMTLLQPAAREKHIDLRAEVAASVPVRVRADARWLRRIIQNLLSNAVRFTDRGDIRIHVTVEAQTATSQTLHVTVRDTGIGLSDLAKQRLFQPFTQADGTMARSYGGVGLGLALCKRLIEAMGGTIGAESVAGQGSTFWFKVQLEPAARQPGVDTASGSSLALNRASTTPTRQKRIQ